MDAILACVFVVFVFFLGIGSGVKLADLLNENKAKKNEKPIIRHCRNCRYCSKTFCSDYCDVKYESIDFGRAKALFCRFYKKKVGGKDDR